MMVTATDRKMNSESIHDTFEMSRKATPNTTSGKKAVAGKLATMNSINRTDHSKREREKSEPRLEETEAM